MIHNTFVEDTSIEGRVREIEIKVSRVRTMLEEQSLEAVVFLKHPNYSWITAGGKSFIANCFDKGEVAVLVTKTKRYAICNVIEYPRVIDEEKLAELGFEVISYGWEVNKLEETIVDIIGDMSLVGSDIPVGHAKLINELINPLRYSLTENEMGRYEYLGYTLSRVLEEYMQTLKPGMTEYEIAGGVSEALWKYNIEQIMHLVAADERSYKYRHALPTDKAVKNNLIVSINGRYKGLITTVSRMVHFGKASDQLLKQYDDCCEMECRTIARAKISAPEINMYNTLKASYVELGYPTMFERHGQGGCQGYYPRDYMVTQENNNLIKENQCYCFNPVVDGTKIEDAFIVTNKGTMFITRPVSFPKIVKEVNGVVMERPGMLVIE